MNKNTIVRKFDEEQLKSEIPRFHVGDTISVHLRIIEGDKERTQIFTGTVIARSGAGLSETFTMHRVAYGEGMERVFLLHSPRIAKIEVKQEGDVRRAKLNYIRGATGKKAKVRRRLVSRYSSPKKKQDQVLAQVEEEVPAVEIPKAVEQVEAAVEGSPEVAAVAAKVESSETEKGETPSN